MNEYDKYLHPSYSQEGEDRIILDLFCDVSKGNYVDVGSHHPVRFSNTHLFYLNGWRGINIDPTPGTKVIFDEVRKEDINLEIGIGAKEEIKTLFMYEDHAINTFDKSRVEFIYEITKQKVKEERQVKIKTLKSVLEENEMPRIDFMNIDVEWDEINVLKSNDWKRLRPKVLLVEILDFKIDSLKENQIHQFLNEISYSFLCKTPRTCFYQDKTNPTRYSP
ncbi:MAG: FkbM family methyltransferase [Leptospiraceae bacterium]|nr:FkbM family methyltransferase [Leptospiraceae bacterium]